MTTLSADDMRRDIAATPRRILSKATIGGFRPNGDPIWVWTDMVVTRDGDGYREALAADWAARRETTETTK